jgi:MoaA/NifB/PqqE/SkfB family radical SAM enzyme
MSDDKKIKPWCVEPFINFAHTADGYYRPCCISTVDRDAGPNTKNMTPLEYWSGEEMQGLRRQMLKGKKHLSKENKEICKQCISNDNQGVQSRRKIQNETYFNNPKVLKVIDKYEDPTYVAQPEDLVYVNWKILGNLCNLKCLMCGPSASSKIAAEWKKHDIFSHGNLIASERMPYNENTIDSYMKDFKTILTKIDRFSLVGGEAFINPNFNEIWDTLSNNDNTHNLTLVIITNGTLLPQKVLDNADKFKKLILLFSIDGVENRGSYVRSGLDWKKFDTNLKRALESNAEVATTVATSMLNIGYLDDIYDYLKSLDIPDKAIKWDAVVTEPAHLRAVNLPIEIKKQYLEKLSKHEAFNKNNKKFDTALETLKSQHNDHEQFIKGLQFLKQTDDIRKTNLLEHFPEFLEYYTTCNQLT